MYLHWVLGAIPSLVMGTGLKDKTEPGEEQEAWESVVFTR